MVEDSFGRVKPRPSRNVHAGNEEDVTASGSARSFFGPSECAISGTPAFGSELSVPRLLLV